MIFLGMEDIYTVKDEHYELLDQYKILKNNIAIFLEEIKITNPIEIMYVVSYIIYAYFSEEKQPNIFVEKQCYSGINPLVGSTICRHINSLYIDILNKMGYDPYKLGSYIGEFKDLFNQSHSSLFDTNHVVTAIHNDTKIIVIDPTWKKSKILNKKARFRMYPYPHYHYIVFDKEKLKELACRTPYITRRKFNTGESRSQKEIIQLLDNNPNLEHLIEESNKQKGTVKTLIYQLNQ